MEVLFDRSESIQEAIHDVELTLILTIALVVGVVALLAGLGLMRLRRRSQRPPCTLRSGPR
jgi:multidrug efflux pump subunit AcrB